MNTPRGSFHTENIKQKIIEFGRSLNLETLSAGEGNILIRKPSQSNNPNAPWICLQAHIDMVCVKEQDCPINLLNDPLEPIIVEDSTKGSLLRAKGTSLGADNGVGVMMLLSLLEDKTLPHGPLEFLFTTDEVCFFF